MSQEYKLKGVTSLDLKDGDKQEYEVEGIEGGKVLLINVAGKTHAMSPNCTHYGAPLKNGVVTSDGRVRCPWHGACFKVSTGDVEDAPALDPLAKFEITEKDGAVYIKGDEPTIKSSRRKVNLKCSPNEKEGVVIIGGGSGAIGAIQSLRENGSKLPITVISREQYPPIDRTKLSKALIADASKIELRPEDWYKSVSAQLVHEEATSVDLGKKSVTTSSGKTIPYTKLILATGGVPKSLPMEGFKDLKNIFLLRGIGHVQEILNAVNEKDIVQQAASAIGVKKGKSIVVIGSSFIGMEVANALAKDNTVTVVGMEKAPLERVMGAEVGKIFQKKLEGSGVKFHMEAGVKKATPSSSDPKKVGAVLLEDGTELTADLVILGIGVAPATEFLKDSGLQLEKDGSLKTNEKFEVSGQKDVYAIGDIATYPYHGPGGDGKLTRIEHWNVAQNAGRIVGASIVKPDEEHRPFFPIFWSALGAQLRYCGNTPNGWDDLVLKGEPDEGKFAAYYTKGETVVAVATMQMDPIMSQSVELMMEGRMPSKAELDRGADPRSIKL